jgi:hypothetical protein
MPAACTGPSVDTVQRPAIFGHELSFLTTRNTSRALTPWQPGELGSAKQSCLGYRYCNLPIAFVDLRPRGSSMARWNEREISGWIRVCRVPQHNWSCRSATGQPDTAVGTCTSTVPYCVRSWSCQRHTAATLDAIDGISLCSGHGCNAVCSKRTKDRH